MNLNPPFLPWFMFDDDPEVSVITQFVLSTIINDFYRLKHNVLTSSFSIIEVIPYPAGV